MREAMFWSNWGEKAGGLTYRMALSASSPVPKTCTTWPGSLVMGWVTTSPLTTMMGMPIIITAQTLAVIIRLMAIWLGMR